MRGLSPGSLVVGLSLVTTLALGAQGTTDMLRGTVRTADGIGIANTAVSALSVITRTLRATTTDRNGRFTLPFPDGGGAYRVSYVASGYEPVTREVKRFADEAILLADATLTRVPIMLAAVRASTPAPM